MFVGGVIVAGRRLGAALEGRPVRRYWRLFALFAVVCLLISVGSAAYTCVFLFRSRAVTATIISFSERKTRADSNEPIYALVYRYDVDGVQHEGEIGVSGHDFSVGDKIPIRYRRDYPEKSRVDHWVYHWGICACGLCGAMVSGCLATIIRLAERSVKRERGV